MNEDQESNTNSPLNEPYIGQEFEDLDSIYNFYNAYARNKGFGIRKNSSAKSQVTKELIWKNFVCDKAGKKDTYSSKESISSKKRRDTRVDCKAKLDARRNKEGLWVITSFVKDHNHELDTPRRTKKHRSHHIYHKSDLAKSAMENLHEAGVGPSMIAKTLNVTGMPEVSSQNVIDHLRKQRKNIIGREGVMVAEYLQAQSLKDPNFFYALELDSDGFLRSLFWADSRARHDYITFGDVIVFDVTYKTNKHLMPFAPFTGVNHHRQSILFGCALLVDETVETFTWLFKSWLSCMFDKAPKVIFTDMDRAMFSAIKIVFPNVRHRFCSWHIHKHLLENVYEMRDAESDFSRDYTDWFNSRTISLSETAWKDLLVKYNLENHKWLAKMWTLRSHWVPAFLKDVFVAGMTSTGRSESINSFFDGFVHSNTNLIEFVKQYEHALSSRRNSEESEDFKTMNSLANLVGSTNIEFQASQCYTRSMFKLFQGEFKQILACGHEKVASTQSTKTYLVGLSGEPKHKWYMVEYEDSNPINVKCECAKFENHGYLCKHILHIFFKKQISHIPEQYILKRWTVQARYILPYGSFVDENSDEVGITSIMKWSLVNLCHNLVEECSKSQASFKDLYTEITRRLEDYKIDQCEHNPTNQEVSIQSGSVSGIRDPIHVRTKGRPKLATRLHSSMEVSTLKGKQRTCGLCGAKGHYATTCHSKAKVND